MIRFDPNNFPKVAQAVKPREEISEGFWVSFDWAEMEHGTSVSIRREELIYSEEEKSTALVLDGVQFQEAWSALEFRLEDGFKSLRLKARFFPIQILHPRVYSDGGTYDLETVSVSDIGSEIEISKQDIESVTGKNFKSGTLALLLPNALWYSIAIFEAEMTHAAD